MTARLARLKAERLKLLQDVRRNDLELGRLAKEAIDADEHTTQSGVARVLGVSHTHVRNLIEAAEAAEGEVAANNDAGIPMLPNEVAGEYVRSRNARIVRSLSAFDATDVLHGSLLDPRLFGDGELCLPPHMLWHLDSGEWVGVTEANVGYGGNGCDLAKDALEAAGIEASAASEIVRWRFCDAVEVDDRSTWITQTIWPASPRSAPRILQDRIVVRFGEAVPMPLHRVVLRGFGRDPDPTGFHRSTPEVDDYQAWLQFLDSEQLPAWGRGTRVARVFLSPAEAEIQGFVMPADSVRARGRRAPCPSIVIEQGDVQLWGYFYPADTRLLSDEVYQALAMAQVYPSDLAAEDEIRDRPLRRFARRFLGADTSSPAFIDISASGQDQLNFVPTPDRR